MALRRLIPNIPKAKVGPRNIPPDTEKYRIAVHEAGHAITAWWCSAVTDINHVIIDNHRGHVDMTIKNNTLDAIWCNLVITLAGLAAETTIYRNVRSGPAATDLLAARELVNILIKNGSTSPSWKINHSSTTLSFEKMFQAPVSEIEKKVMDAGYQHARYLLEQYFNDHHRLVVHLLQHRRVSGMEMETLFGNRTSTTMFGLFRATFVGAP